MIRKLFVIDDLDAWNPNLRSKAAIRTSPTRHLCDPSVAVAALGTGPGELMSDLNTFGLLFESMAVRDLRCYADAIDGEVLHYRDKSGLECDAVIRLRDGRYGLIEVKLGGESALIKFDYHLEWGKWRQDRGLTGLALGGMELLPCL